MRLLFGIVVGGVGFWLQVIPNQHHDTHQLGLRPSTPLFSVGMHGSRCSEVPSL